MVSKMLDFIKTSRGLAEIKQRNLSLNARQRQLLFLIDTPAFTQLSKPQQQQIATHDLLDQLLHLNLITFKTDASEKQYRVFKKQQQTLIDKVLDPKPSTTVASTAKVIATRAPPKAVEFKVLSFYDIQQLMTESLHRYCGLLAKILIEQILQAQTTQHLKNCQMQWITHLQESRMPALELSLTLQQINFAIKVL